jgi:hypothetical protein
MSENKKPDTDNNTTIKEITNECSNLRSSKKETVSISSFTR